MSHSKARIRVWCEDRQHEQLARELLSRRLQVERRRISFEIAPKGKGAASQWVISRYPDVEKKARQTRHQGLLGFLVIVDGDNQGLRQRKRDLCGDPDRRQDNDRIAIWVPTWSVETWILWLCRQQVDNHEVDEARSYKGVIDAGGFNDRVGQAVAAWEPPRTDEVARLPALDDARHELERLPLG
jgi:hypothetical protein